MGDRRVRGRVVTMSSPIPTVHVSDSIRERSGCARRKCRRVAIVTSQFRQDHVMLHHESDVAAITPDGPLTVAAEPFAIRTARLDPGYLTWVLMEQHKQFDKAARTMPVPVSDEPKQRIDGATGREY